MTDGMVVARIAKAGAINDHRGAFKFSLTFWFFCVKTKEQLNKIINLKYKIMATTSFTTFKLTLTAAQLKTANNIAIDIPQLAAPGRGFGPLHQVFRSGLASIGRIRQRKDNWTINLARHLSHNRFGKRAAECGKPNQNRRIHIANYRFEINHARRRPLPRREAFHWLRINTLLRSQIAPLRVQQAAAVHNPETATGFFF